MADRTSVKEQPEWGIKFSKWFFMPQRIILSLMGFLAMVTAYTMRVCLSLAITNLVEKKVHEQSKGDYVCPVDVEKETASKGGGQYTWSEELQGRILSSFYVGYIISHIPGGMLADRFGGKWVLSLGILAAAVFTLITPLCINEGGPTALIVSRVFMGVGEGTTFPALSVLLAHWVPLKERGELGALVFGGGQIGSLVGNLLSGHLIHEYGWESVFYVFGIGGLVWFIVFTFLCFSGPSTHPFIKPSEKKYLMQTMGPVGRIEYRATPWKAILTNVPMYALVAAQIGHDWGFYIMVTDLPKYMANVMGFSIKSNGLYSSLPFVSMWVISLGSGFVGDCLITREILSITNTRKVMTGIAAFGPAVFMIAASYAGCNRLIVVIYFTVCMGLMGTYYAGMKLSPLDMSPNYAGTLMAITNGIGSITGVIAPYLVGVMTPNATLMEWRLVFWVAFGVLCGTGVVYCIWASGEVQPFNDPPKRRDLEAEEKLKYEKK